MKRILVDMEVNEEALKRLKSIPGANVEVVKAYDEGPRSLPIELIKDINVLFCTYPPSNLDDMASLEYIQIASAGYTQLFNLGLVERGIRACNAQGVFDIPIGEWCISMMVNLVRNLRGMIRNQEHGVWDRSACFQKEIRDSIVGIWGYGAIGREIARLSKVLGMKIFVMDRAIPLNSPRNNIYSVPGTGDPECMFPDRTFVTGQEKEFLKELDFLILTMPLTKNTEGIVGEEELKALPSTAYILNPARGQLIKEEALLKALRGGWIAGAALDTHYYYPMPADHPLWCFPNVIMTPHISGSSLSQNFTARIWDIFVQNIERYVHGRPLLNELSQSQLKGE